MKYIKGFFKWFIGTLLLIVLLLYITDYEYILKGVRVVYMTGHTTAYIDDHPYFENMTIKKGDDTQSWPKHKGYNTIKPTQNLITTHEKLGTVAYVIIKNDSLWYEYYGENYGPESQTNSFSVAKSITTSLMAKAIQDGYIKSLNQPIGDFFERYASDKTTVGDLASMSSGLDWDESYTSPFSVTARAYYDDDISETILQQKVVEEPGRSFKYLSGIPNYWV